MEDQNYRWQLVSKKLAGKTTDDENLELQKLLDSDPYLTALMVDLSNLWAVPNNDKKPAKLQKE